MEKRGYFSRQKGTKSTWKVVRKNLKHYIERLQNCCSLFVRKLFVDGKIFAVDRTLLGPWYMLSNVRSKTAKFWHLCTDDFSAVSVCIRIRLTLLDRFCPHY